MESAQRYPLNKEPRGDSTCSTMSQTRFTRDCSVVLDTEVNILRGNRCKRTFLYLNMNLLPTGNLLR